MITVELATTLRDAGLRWSAVPGDRFVIPDRDLDDEVFVISHMTIDTARLETGDVVRFNGTTEWALDSLEQTEVVWLPREGQLRALLGERFVALEAVPTDPAGFAVVLEYDDRQTRHVDIDAERAYARALLELIEQGTR